MTILRQLAFFFFLWVSSLALQAQQVTELSIPSPSMNREIRNLVILPEGYDGSKRFPVLYLLHGYNMPYTDWLVKQPELPQLASQYGYIVVCPDAGNSWYFDSPAKPDSLYESYVSKELIAYMDEHYATIAQKSGRAICGLSMGGHGALWLAFRHQDTYGACGSTSGAVNILPYTQRYGLPEVLGDYAEHAQRWADHTVINQVHLVNPGLAIIFDCGVADFFHQDNENLHKALLERKIPHDYISRPGTHNTAYWRNSTLYLLLYFAEYFRQQR